jgi:hypothetical protein
MGEAIDIVFAPSPDVFSNAVFFAEPINVVFCIVVFEMVTHDGELRMKNNKNSPKV